MHKKAQIIWLLSTCFLIWVLIIVGGITRLTHAGLSIVEWNPITGIIPPLTDQAWINEFTHYQQFPEYQHVNQGMTLGAFKGIFWMEFAHRLLARLIGLWFFAPLVYFWIKGQLTSSLKRRSLLILLLGGLQGFVGWYMVKSGLIKDPTVSHYRLTLHLGLALMLYGVLLWTAFDLINISPHPSLSSSIINLTRISCGAVIVTILYGGLVAGLKAGLIYNTFPLMEGQWLPGEWLFLKPWWWNFLENHATVQWTHRLMALITLACIGITTLKISQRPSPHPLKQAALLFAAAAVLQTILGIITLLATVPIALAALHQASAVLLLSCGLWTLYQASGKTLNPKIEFYS